MTIAAVAGGESAGATGEGERRHCRRGEREQYRRRMARITGGDEHRYYQRGPQLAVTQRVSASVTRGESPAVTGEARGGVIGGTGGDIAGGVKRRHYRRGPLQDRTRRALTPALSPPVTSAVSSPGNACSRPHSQILIAMKRNGLERIRTSDLHSPGWVR